MSDPRRPSAAADLWELEVLRESVSALRDAVPERPASERAAYAYAATSQAITDALAALDSAILATRDEMRDGILGGSK